MPSSGRPAGPRPSPDPQLRGERPGARGGERRLPGRSPWPEARAAVICSLFSSPSPLPSLRAPRGGVLDKPCRLWALTSESILSQMGTIDWNEKLILNQ